MPSLKMSLQMQDTFADNIDFELGDIVSPETDKPLVDFLSTSDAANMLIQWRSVYKSGENMHHTYYDAIKTKGYKKAADIAVAYIKEFKPG